MSQSWLKYYTPYEVALNLLDLIPKDFKPDHAIDICMGQGNFLNACKLKWPDVKLTGSDIDLNISKNDKTITTFEIDALEILNLKHQLNISNHSKNLIVANPPFGRINKYVPNESKQETLYAQASKLKRIEAFMLISNLSLMKEGDYFAAILPENFFTSVKFETFRNSFLSFFKNIYFSESRRLFIGSEVKTRLFVGMFTGYYDFDLTNAKTAQTKFPNTRYKLFRGIDNSKLGIVNKGLNQYQEVLHFSNKQGNILNRRYIETNEYYNRLKISKNDLLILRVGRNTGMVFPAKSKYIGKLISDYFYLLKDHSFSNSQIEQLHLKLLSNVNGVTTKYLTKHQIETSINMIN